MCMDAEALVELREVLENSLGHVNRREERVACLPDVLGIMPEAACQITKKCMIFPVLAVMALFASCPVSLRLYASIYSEH